MSADHPGDGTIGAAPFTVEPKARKSGRFASQQEVVEATLPNGPGAAAILAAGIGSLALGIFAFSGDASPTILRLFNFWTPTGPLSGVTLTAVVVWLVAWFGLGRSWRNRTINLRPVNLAAFIMLVAGLLLTFPPFMDFLQGK